MERILMRMKSGDCGICTFASIADISYEDSLEFFRKSVWEKDKDRKIPLVWKNEMESALTKFNLTFYKRNSVKYIGLIGGTNPVILHPRAPGFFRHWIIYLPDQKYVIDPDPGQPDQVFDLIRYKVPRKYFEVDLQPAENLL